MVHSPITYNDASSEFFITTHALPRDSPSGSRLLDGRYTLFGHVLEGVELLPTLAAGDMIQTITVTSGADLMQRPDPNPIYTRRSGKSQRDYQMLSGEGIEESLIPATVPLSKEEAAPSQTGSDSTAQY
uniref:PPIase cyclophilin-type domain-containing protein n=2 Tax=Chrysotila carterae TaxID=13221 RepID=A0A7S4C4A3_CHRCT